MKNYNPIYFILLLASIFAGCQNHKDNSEKEDIVFKKIIDKDLEVFKKYDSIHYLTSEYYIRAILICNSADNLVQSISQDNLNEDSVKAFNQNLNEYSRMTEFSLNYDEFEDASKSEIIFKIRTYQTLAVNALLNIYKRPFFPMELVVPVFVPRKTDLKVGEIFIADIYLAGNNFTNKYIVTVNNDTVKYNKERILPVFEEVAINKGLKTINATMEVYHAGLEKKIKMDFQTHYTVK